MAYKNQKHNKRHVKKLQKDPDNWRKRKKKKAIKNGFLKEDKKGKKLNI